MDTLVASNLPASSSNMDLRAYCDHASKMRESSDIAQIAAALVRAQAVLDSPPRNREVLVRTKTGGTYTFRYATLDKIMETIRAALGGNGLCVLQPIVSTQRGPVLVTRLLHESGQWMECEIPLPTLGDSLQDFGSAVSYVRRYAVSAMLNITADEDDDGNTAAGNHVADAPRHVEGRRGPARPVPHNGPARAETGTPGTPRDGTRPDHGRDGAPRGDGGNNSAAPTRTQVTPQPAPTKVVHQASEGSAPPASPRQPDAAPPRTARPEPASSTQALPPPGTSGQITGMPAKAAAVPRQVPDATRRRKDEAAPASVWGILRPGKAAIRAPDGAAWLKWWTGIAAKAKAEGKLDDLRTRYEANTATWDEIALASPETEAVVAQAAQAVRAALDG